MANNPWDRTVINTRERPLSSDINQAQSQIDRTLRFFLDQLFIGRRAPNDDRVATLPSQGFIGGGFKVREESPIGLSVLLSSGQGFQANATDTPSSIGGVTSVDDLSRYKPLVVLSDVTIAVPAADPTFDRIDIVEVAFNRRLADPTSRDILNPSSGAFEPETVNKSLAWNMEGSVGIVTTPASSTTAIGYKAGNPSATPTTPPTTAGYIRIAEVVVAAAATQINDEDIKDLRDLLAPYDLRYVSAQADLAAPTLDKLCAPPGVMVAANNSGGTFRLYVIAGDVGAANPIIIGSGAGSFTANPEFTASVINVDEALKTDLQNAVETNPVLNVVGDAVLTAGQSAIRVEVSGTGTYGFQIWW